jgi:RES domain-containing protein
MVLWSISNYATLDGVGGLFASARWHTQGHRIVYLAETPAGALAEILVHLELDLEHLPTSYKLLKTEGPGDISIRTISPLPPDWNQHVVVSRTIGDEWLTENRHALLRVPSAIIPETFNALLNPQHPDAARVKVLWHQEYPWNSACFDNRLPASNFSL